MAKIKIHFKRACCMIRHSSLQCGSGSRCPGLTMGEGDTLCAHRYEEDVAAEQNGSYHFSSGDPNGVGGKFVSRGIYARTEDILYLSIDDVVIIGREVQA